jgi:hypothetical protein
MTDTPAEEVPEATDEVYDDPNIEPEGFPEHGDGEEEAGEVEDFDAFVAEGEQALATTDEGSG